MKKTILYIAMSAAIAAVSVIAIIGCNDGGANAGRVSEEVNAFLNKFDNAVPAATVTPPDTSSGGTRCKLITNVSTPEGGMVLRNPDKADYEFGEPVRVTAAPAEGYEFKGWSGAASGMANPVMVTMNGNQALTAEFREKTRFTVTFDGNDPPAVTADSGSSITLPDRQTMQKAGHSLWGWNTKDDGTGEKYPTHSSYTVTRNVTMFAVWTLVNDSITYALNGGSVASANPTSYTIETPSFILNNPSRACYTFAGWTGSNGTTPQTSVTVAQGGTGALNYTANWNAITYTLTTNVSPPDGGTVSRSPYQATPYSCGTNVTVTAVPTNGYVFMGWSGASTSTNASVSITMNSNLTVTANFEKILGTFTDSRDGKTYNTVRIGNQRWMAENLNYDITSGAGSWCLGNSAGNCTKYGRLYNWNTAMAGSTSSTANPSGVRGVCPSSWHLPSDSEWDALITAVGGSSTAGTKLKSTSGWNSYTSSGVTYSGNGTDEYGFSALPGGYRSEVYYAEAFVYAGDFGYWWTATEYGASGAYSRGIYYGNDYVDYGGNFKVYGYSVRCVED